MNRYSVVLKKNLSNDTRAFEVSAKNRSGAVQAAFQRLAVSQGNCFMWGLHDVLLLDVVAPSNPLKRWSVHADYRDGEYSGSACILVNALTLTEAVEIFMGTVAKRDAWEVRRVDIVT